jgi:hypothetical protein
MPGTLRPSGGYLRIPEMLPDEPKTEMVQKLIQLYHKLSEFSRR